MIAHEPSSARAAGRWRDSAGTPASASRASRRARSAMHSDIAASKEKGPAGEEKRDIGAIALRAAGQVAVYVAGAAIPFLLWMAYLYLSFGGIKDAGSSSVPCPSLGHRIFPELSSDMMPPSLGFIS